MITEQNQIDYFKRIAKMQFATMILEDYNSDDDLILLTDSIANIYKYLNYTSFQSVTIYKPLEQKFYLSNLGLDPITINSLENLAPLSGDTIILELKKNGTIDISLNEQFNLDLVRTNGIIYNFQMPDEIERFYGKTQEKELIPIPGADSHFAIQTFKELENALENYKTKVARHSLCEILKHIWFDTNKIFFRRAPEHRLRDSLTNHLKITLRNTEVRPEQIVDSSHPVDIKITWALVNRLALIEIKWLGKSLKTRKKQFTQIYTDARALSGASQLSNYLDENQKQAPNHISKGYLIVFDARRGNCNTQTTKILKEEGLKYINSEINYNPDFHKSRTDFAKPIRFFMEPNYTY